MNRFHCLRASLLALALASPSFVSAEESCADLIKRGDTYDEKFQPKEALACYLPAEKTDQKNVALLLRIARQYRHLMADTEGASEKGRLCEIGKEYALRARGLAPKDAEANLSVAICYAKMMPLLDNKAKMMASSEVKAAVDKALALDPKQDLAWHILGCWNQRLADMGMFKRALAQIVYGPLPSATNEDAVKCFQEAIKLDPNRPMYHIELGRTYAQMGQTAEARRAIEKGLAMPNVGKDDPETKVRGRETLESLR